MADTGDSGAAEKATPPAGPGTAITSTLGAHPGITIVTFWQGILEIVLRGIGIVS